MAERPAYLSLSPLIHWLHGTRPVDWDRVFGRPADLEVELGFGLGDFLVRTAGRYPDKNFVGIDLGWVQVKRALRKIARARLKNVRVVRADARVALERLFPEKSIKRIWCLFPCPWPKGRHARHRLFSGGFLRLMNSRLGMDGNALVVTDHRPYFEWIRARVPGTGFEDFPEITPPRFFTKYERKWRDLGQDRFYSLRLIKREHLPVAPKEDLELITHIIDHFAPERFRPGGNRGELMVEFKEFLYDPGARKGMVRTVVKEESLLQNFWIEIALLEDGWHIRPARGCGFVPTAGVQRSLDLVRDAAVEG